MDFDASLVVPFGKKTGWIFGKRCDLKCVFLGVVDLFGDEINAK